jgi:hypothetical protein
MQQVRPHGWVSRLITFFRYFRRRDPSNPCSNEIGREYIEGETANEIGEIGEMTNIPDKSDRHPTDFQKSEKRCKMCTLY